LAGAFDVSFKSFGKNQSASALRSYTGNDVQALLEDFPGTVRIRK
jgi:hypothetical protein